MLTVGKLARPPYVMPNGASPFSIPSQLDATTNRVAWDAKMVGQLHPSFYLKVPCDTIHEHSWPPWRLNWYICLIYVISRLLDPVWGPLYSKQRYISGVQMAGQMHMSFPGIALSMDRQWIDWYIYLICLI